MDPWPDKKLLALMVMTPDHALNGLNCAGRGARPMPLNQVRAQVTRSGADEAFISVLSILGMLLYVTCEYGDIHELRLFAEVWTHRGAVCSSCLFLGKCILSRLS